ncbi:unnamed protein product [Amoebophrya sp. A120]|nr:unnamed protein product [Amoebophrya sp. A120]|eukprot:GSA120T00011352001.1
MSTLASQGPPSHFGDGEAGFTSEVGLPSGFRDEEEVGLPSGAIAANKRDERRAARAERHHQMMGRSNSRQASGRQTGGGVGGSTQDLLLKKPSALETSSSSLARTLSQIHSQNPTSMRSQGPMGLGSMVDTGGSSAPNGAGSRRQRQRPVRDRSRGGGVDSEVGGGGSFRMQQSAPNRGGSPGGGSGPPGGGPKGTGKMKGTSLSKGKRSDYELMTQSTTGGEEEDWEQQTAQGIQKILRQNDAMQMFFHVESKKWFFVPRVLKFKYQNLVRLTTAEQNNMMLLSSIEEIKQLRSDDMVYMGSSLHKIDAHPRPAETKLPDEKSVLLIGESKIFQLKKQPEQLMPCPEMYNEVNDYNGSNAVVQPELTCDLWCDHGLEHCNLTLYTNWRDVSSNEQTPITKMTLSHDSDFLFDTSQFLTLHARMPEERVVGKETAEIVTWVFAVLCGVCVFGLFISCCFQCADCDAELEDHMTGEAGHHHDDDEDDPNHSSSSFLTLTRGLYFLTGTVHKMLRLPSSTTSSTSNSGLAKRFGNFADKIYGSTGGNSLSSESTTPEKAEIRTLISSSSPTGRRREEEAANHVGDVLAHGHASFLEEQTTSTVAGATVPRTEVRTGLATSSSEQENHGEVDEVENYHRKENPRDQGQVDSNSEFEEVDDEEYDYDTVKKTKFLAVREKRVKKKVSKVTTTKMKTTLQQTQLEHQHETKTKRTRRTRAAGIDLHNAAYDMENQKERDERQSAAAGFSGIFGVAFAFCLVGLGLTLTYVTSCFSLDLQRVFFAEEHNSSYIKHAAARSTDSELLQEKDPRVRLLCLLQKAMSENESEPYDALHKPLPVLFEPRLLYVALKETPFNEAQCEYLMLRGELKQCKDMKMLKYCAAAATYAQENHKKGLYWQHDEGSANPSSATSPAESTLFTSSGTSEEEFILATA